MQSTFPNLGLNASGTDENPVVLVTRNTEVFLGLFHVCVYYIRGGRSRVALSSFWDPLLPVSESAVGCSYALQDGQHCGTI